MVNSFDRFLMRLFFGRHNCNRIDPEAHAEKPTSTELHQRPVPQGFITGGLPDSGPFELSLNGIQTENGSRRNVPRIIYRKN